MVVRNFGGPEALEIVDLAVPEPAAGQVRIRVQAAAVNPVDIATRAGWLAEHGVMAPNGPVAIGWDVAGTVDAVGADVTGLVSGDRVIGLRDLLTAPIGTYAEHLVLDADAVALAPRSASAAEAATLPLNGLTAVQALNLLGLQRGQWLLVTGAAGGLGGFVVELAALRGLRVLAVAGAGDEQLVRRLGAEEFVARDPALGRAVRRVVPGGVDGAIDAAVLGAPTLDAVRGGGGLIAVAAGAAPPPLRGTHVENVWIRADAQQLAELSALVDAGKLTLRVASVEALEHAAAAHERLERGGVRGRIVLEP